MPDATTTTENNLAPMGFASFQNYKPGIAEELERGTKYPREMILITEPYKHTAVAQNNNFIIPHCSASPEKAMELWNLMYTDADVSTLFVDGIEGKHWVWTDAVSYTHLASPLPVYAMGGVGPGNIAQVKQAGAAGACVMSGFMTAPDPARLVGQLRKEAEL